MEANNILEPGRVHLRRLSRFIDVVYALLFFHILSTYLPHFEGMGWMDKPYGLLSHLYDGRNEMLRIFIGAGLTVLYWNQNTKLFRNLARTNFTHGLLSIVQLLFVVLFVYFAIADPDLQSKSSPALQAASLAIAGFIGILALRYAYKKQLMHENMTETDLQGEVRANLMEPMTATINTGLAFVGPLIWTIGWFVLPVVISRILKAVGR